MRIYIIVSLLGCFLWSCGPKKGIVTKKKNAPTERVVKTQVPVKTVDKDEEIRTIPETVATKPAPINSTEAYIAAFGEIAMIEMRKYKIPASITLAQGILESGSGRGRLAVEASNHFGIKCHGWEGEKIYHNDDASQECFRKYNDPLSSFEDHSKFLTGRPRYADLFKLKEDDYKGWAKGLRQAGYATDRQYPEKLISLIERYRLYEYDDTVLNNTKRAEVEVSSNNTEQTSIHIVQQGDTLYSLSKKYNTTVEKLQQLNRLSSNSISIGQELKINK